MAAGSNVTEMPSRLGALLTPLRIAAIYLAFGLAALLFSDVLLVSWIDDPARLRDLQAASAWPRWCSRPL